MKVTMREIAEEAGVSIATVSFALNRTRYVSPELVERIEQVAQSKGYRIQTQKKKQFHSGKLSEIALVIPSVKSDFYAHLMTGVSRYASEKGYLTSVHVTSDDREQERRVLQEIISNNRIAGIILAPASEERSTYEKLLQVGSPLICIERTIVGADVGAVLSDNEDGVYKGMEYLIKRGHENIAILLEDKHMSCVEERTEGYQKALEQYHIPFRQELVVSVNPYHQTEMFDKVDLLFKCEAPTAIFAAGNKLTLNLLRMLAKLEKAYSADISIIGFGDAQWCDMIRPSLTCLRQDQERISREAVRCTIEQIAVGSGPDIGTKRIPMELWIGDSVQNIARGPFGERSEYPGEIVLSEEDSTRLKLGRYKVGISFHYGGDDWTTLHERALVETLNGYGIQVLSVMDAHFDAKLQEAQLKGLMMQNPDVIIAVPVEEEKTASVFKEVAEKTKLVLINSMPKGFTRDDYACWISVNERENGESAARILGDYFVNKGSGKVAMLIHGAEYFATKQRDFFARQTLEEDYPGIEIIASESFGKIENAYQACYTMMESNPEIEGIYVTWERPALEAIRALKDMGRQDVVISTTDLDYEIARMLWHDDMVIGISSQRPYDQGMTAAIETAKVLLGKQNSKCIGVSPYRINKENLEKAWKDLKRTKMPDFS
jgi:ribose transport system substrate-binding protein